MARILVVDDEEKIREMIYKYGVHEGFEITQAQNGKEAVALCADNDFDLIIMDVMMPEMNGFNAYKKIRNTKNIPCIFLTALNEEYDRIYGFGLGADDYVAKPFSFKELIMRIKAILNRTLKNSGDNIIIDTLKLDLDTRTLTIDKEEVTLSLKEYELLLYFLENPNKVITRETLLFKIWGYDYFGDDRTLDTHIKLLRKDLKQYSSRIITHRGVGYRFEK